MEVVTFNAPSLHLILQPSFQPSPSPKPMKVVVTWTHRERASIHAERFQTVIGPPSHRPPISYLSNYPL
jgi:hypothetical protein